MKKQILQLALLSLSSASVHAQTVSAKKMIELPNCKNLDCYSSYLLHHGFKYESGSKIDENANLYSFYSEKKFAIKKTSPHKIENAFSFLLPISERNINGCTFSTCDVDIYNKLIAEFKLEGYKASSSSTENNEITTTYTSVNHTGAHLNVTIEAKKMGTETGNLYVFNVSY